MTTATKSRIGGTLFFATLLVCAYGCTWASERMAERSIVVTDRHNQVLVDEQRQDEIAALAKRIYVKTYDESLRTDGQLTMWSQAVAHATAVVDSPVPQ
jgi:hypothetical protein